jgi:hypothetical protein
MWIHLDFGKTPIGELTDDNGEPFAVLSSLRMDRDVIEYTDSAGLGKHVPGGLSITMHFDVTDEELAHGQFDRKPA